jgi:hypothetical protein
MANTIESKYGANSQGFTCTLASLASAAARASTAIDNTTNLFLDVLVFVAIKTASSGVSATGYVNVYVYGTVDGGANYTEGATGTDAAITLTAPPNARLVGVINCVANATTYKGGPMSVAAAFGGALPDHWGIIVENRTGNTLDATEGNHQKTYQGVLSQVV